MMVALGWASVTVLSLPSTFLLAFEHQAYHVQLAAFHEMYT